MQTVPAHVRRGLPRLYFVVAVRWVAWSGYQLIDASSDYYYHQAQREREAFWSLLAVPLGAPLAYLIIVWIVDGFPKPTARREDPQLGPARRSSADCYRVISRAKISSANLQRPSDKNTHFAELYRLG